MTLDDLAPSEEAAEPDPLPPGTMLGDRFEIGERLGSGGMGAVYRAYDLELDQQVAVKLLLGGGTGARETERFRREAQLAREVTHPGVLRVYEYGDSPHGPYLVMELVAGESLQARLDRDERLPPDEALRIVRRVLEGLGAAHLAGIVHRDIKPANVLVDGAGRVVLADFGVARRPGRPGVTRAGAVVGTPAYMAPEQFRGEEVDARADLYAVGALGYALLLGAPPLRAVPDVSARREHIASVAGTSPGLAEVVAACLAADPHERPASAEAALALLDAPPTAKRSRARPWAIGGAALVAAGALALAALRDSRPAGVLVDAVEIRGPAPAWAAEAARDVAATALAGYVPSPRGRERHLRPVVTLDASGWSFAVGEVEARGATLDEAGERLVRELHPDAPRALGELELASARAAWSAGRREEALAALDRIADGGGWAGASLRAVAASPGSSAARDAALRLAAIHPSTPPQDAVAAGLVALATAAPAAGAIDALESTRSMLTRGDPDRATVAFRLLWREHRVDEALAVLEEQTRARPRDPVGWRWLGEAHLRRGDLGSARTALARFAELHPGSALAIALGGEVDLRSGDRSAAAAALARADALGPASAGMRLAVLLSVEGHLWSAARAAARRGLADAGTREGARAYLAWIDAAERGDRAAAERIARELDAAER